MKSIRIKNIFAILFVGIFSLSAIGMTALSKQKSVVAQATELPVVTKEINEEVSTIKSGDKFYCNATLEDDFAPDAVLVTLDESISNVQGIDDELLEKIFGDIDYSKIEDLSAIPEPSEALLEYYETHSFRQVLKLPLSESTKENVLKVIHKLEKIDGIVCAEPDYYHYLSPMEMYNTYSLETATSFVSVDDSRDPYIDQQWALTAIDAEEAWATGSGVRVGIMDTGIAEHEDLNANVAQGTDFTGAQSGANVDNVGHGTYVAGVIGAVKDNGIGIAGIAPKATLVSLKVSDGPLATSDSVFSKAIQYATQLWGTDKQISILNFATAGFGTRIGILSSIDSYPGLFVWSAGNDKQRVDSFPYIYQFNSTNIISVGAINENYDLWESSINEKGSNYGNYVNIYAPGDNILSTGPGNQYLTNSGTSLAAPYVAGVAALIWSQYPGLTAFQVKNAIINGAKIMNDRKCLSAKGALEVAEQLPKSTAYLRFESAGKINGDWGIYIINDNHFTVNVTYNNRMCFENDAKNFKNLVHLYEITIAPNSSQRVVISENGTAGYIVAAINVRSGNTITRRISYTNGITPQSTNKVEHNNVEYRLSFPQSEKVPDYLTFTPIKKSGLLFPNWQIKISNPNNFEVQVRYNSRMCFENDAKYFTENLVDTKTIQIGANATSEPIDITSNGTAGYIVICVEYRGEYFDYRKVTFANGISLNSTNGPYYNFVRKL